MTEQPNTYQQLLKKKEPSMPDDRLLRMRRLSTVPRWTIVQTLRQQSVAEHTFHVLALAMWLGPRHASMASGSISMGEVIEYAICHDEFEAFTGDIAAPAKRWGNKEEIDRVHRIIGTPDPHPSVKNIVKCADLLEALVFLHEEAAMGNSTVSLVVDDIMSKFRIVWQDFKYAYKGKLKPGHSEFVAEVIYAVKANRHPALELLANREYNHDPSEQYDIKPKQERED